MKRPNLGYAIVLLCMLFVLLSGCVANSTKHVTSIIDFLYPNANAPIATPGVPELKLPLRVGIAFVPGKGGGNYGRDMKEFHEEVALVIKELDKNINKNNTNWKDVLTEVEGKNQRKDSSVCTSDEFFKNPAGDCFKPHGIFELTEQKKLALMEQVADHFKQYSFIKEIQIIPSDELKPGGSFANLDRIRAVYGVDVIALLSYDQAQFTEDGVFSITYWTIVGAYVIPGAKNDTHTILDAAIFDIKGRTMLFRAPGTSHIKGIASPANLTEQIRSDSDAGFDAAVKPMITNLDEQLALFQNKVKEHPTDFKILGQ